MEMEKIIKDYVLQLLKFQKIRLECINLGFNQTKETKVEISMIEMALKEIEKRW